MTGPLSDTMKQAPDAGAGTPEGVPGAGEVIAGKYRVERVLGVGGMGVVLAVHHITLGELYAMKFLLGKSAQNGEAVARFMREARAAVRIKSEHIARVNDFGQLESGSPYIVMEHLEGMDLAELMQRSGPQSPTLAADFVIQACAGLAEAHHLGIVHRDLKPSNLFVTRRADGSPLVKVLDFGISKAAADSAQPAITSTHESFGSPAYMSPEQIRSAKNVDARSDVFALGVILFELLTGRLPFEGETSAGLLAAISADAPTRLSEVRPDADGELEAVIARCLQKRPDDRFPSVSALASALSPFAGADSQSLIQRIGRIGSPSNIPPPLSLSPPPLSSGRDSGRNAKQAALAATERPWTTQTKDGGATRSVVFMLLGAVSAVILVGGGMLALRSTLRSEGNATSTSNVVSTIPATAPVPPQPSIATGAVPTAPPEPTTAASHAAARPPSSKPASDTPGTSMCPGSTTGRGKPAVTVPTAPSASTSPVVSAAPPAKPVPTTDPTAESH